MGASEHYRVDERVLAHELVDAFLHEIVGSGTVGLVGLHDGGPQRTRHARHHYVGEELAYLERVALALDCAFGGKDAHMTAARDVAYDLRRRTDDAEHTPLRVELGQIALLCGNPRSSRAVGYALHVNPYPGVVPCHRVVNREGRLAPAFAFGGAQIQKELLEKEGVPVEEREGLYYVDMGIYCWNIQKCCQTDHNICYSNTSDMRTHI